MSLIENGFTSHEDLASRETLSFEETANILAALDSEPKCLLLAGMTPNHIYGRNELSKVLRTTQGKNPGWLLSERSPWAYCSVSFEPIGLVANEVVDKNKGTMGFIKTKRGDLVGTALAGLLLDFSLKYDASLYQILGSTSSSSVLKEVEVNYHEKIDYRKRSPGTRLRIFQELAKSDGSLTNVDLAQELGENTARIAQHLRELARKDIIGYESIEFGSTFKRTGGDNTKSRVFLSESQQMMMQDFLDRVNSIKNMDPKAIRKGNLLSMEIIRNQASVNELMLKAKNTSSHSSNASYQERVNQILGILKDDKSLSVNQIRKELEDGGENLSDSRIRSILGELRNVGRVESKKEEARVKYWSSIYNEN